MKKMIIIILVCLFVIPAQAKEFLGCKYKTGAPDFDGWSIAHAFGGGISYIGYRFLKCEPYKALALTFITGYFYEIYKDGYGNPIPLTGGKDYAADLKGDPLFVLLGGTLAMISDLLYTQYQFYIDLRRDQIGIYIDI